MNGSGSSPISVPAEIIAKCNAPEQAQSFDRLFRAVMSVPKATIDKADEKWKRKQAKKKLASGS
ncbi:MAG: hypothetical protein ABL962_07755 [Fimbriimonadaceae bacterium]